MSILKNPDVCPNLTDRAEKFEVGIRDFLKDSPAEVESVVREQIARDGKGYPGIYVYEYSLFSSILMNDLLEAVVDETIEVGLDIYRQRNGSVPADFMSELQAVKALLLNAFIPVHYRVEEIIDLELPFDIAAWARENYTKPLSFYRTSEPKKIPMRIPNVENYERYWNDTERSAEEKYLHYLVTINSAARRRTLVPVEVGAVPEPELEAKAASQGA